MNTDLIAQLSKLNPTKRQWVYDGIRLIRCFRKNLFITHDAKKDDIHLTLLAPAMRLEILKMAKEIERLNEQNIDLANRFNLQSQEIEELKSELELERFEEDDSHLYDEDNLTPQP